jgi:hypothetical protein
MIAKIHKATLSDKSEVYDVLIEESGVTMASISCRDEDSAVMLLNAICRYSNVDCIWNY